MLVADLGRIDPPEPELTSGEMLERARALRPILRERQSLCEELDGCLTKPTKNFCVPASTACCSPACSAGTSFRSSTSSVL